MVSNFQATLMPELPVGRCPMPEHRRTTCLAIWLSLLLLGVSVGTDAVHSARADDVIQTASETSPSTETTDDKASGNKIAPDKFSEVDKLTNLTVFTLLVCVLGVVALMALIVVGARRLRTMTRSPLLKSKYDELELLREKYRREVEGLDTPPPASREKRR